MSAHHELGPSQWGRLWNCAGSAALCASLPEDPESRYAWDGTCAHALLERCIVEGEFDAHAFCDLPMEAKGKTFTVTREMCDAVQVAVVHFAELTRDSTAEYWAETKLDLGHVWPGLFGTADITVYCRAERHLHVIDYKHGAGVAVAVEGNKQTRAYALGALNTFKGLDVDAVTCWIVQPRCAHGGDPVRSETYHVLDLYEFAAEARVKLAETQCPGAKRNPGEWCTSTFCRGASQMACPEFKGVSTAHLNEHFLPQQPAHCGPDELGERLAAVPQIRAYLKSLEDYAYRQAMQGSFPSGYNFYEGRGSRSWAAPMDAQNLSAHIGLPVSDVVTTKLRSPADLEKAVGKKRFAEKCAHFVETIKSVKLEKEAPGKTPLSLIEVQTRNKADAFSILDNPET